MTPRTSIARLADCAPVADPDSWVARKIPGTRVVEIRHPYIDETPVMNAVHAALEAEARSTAIAVIKYRARMYALRPRDLDAIMDGFSSLPPEYLVASLSVIRMSSINPRGAMLYARYIRAKARQIARRAA